jgi:hypothetical protein
MIYPNLLLALPVAAAPSIMAAPSTAAVAIASQTDPAKLAAVKQERDMRALRNKQLVGF